MKYPLLIGGVAVSLAMAFCTCTLSAQTYTPKTVVFTGASAYSSADLLTASGLKIGKPVTKQAIEGAMHKLDETGLFADMRYNVDDRALTFTLTPQPPKAMLPASYSNFVVLDPGQIQSLIRARVPLFAGYIPNNGNLQQQVQDALTAILLDQGIKARVDSVLSQERGTSMAFFIADPPVQIRTLTVSPVSPEAQAKVDAVRKAYASMDYDNLSDSSIRLRLADTYRDLGFLDIAVDPTTRTAPTVEPSRIAVDVSAIVHEGGAYRITSFNWPASAIVSPAAFAKAAQIKPGEPASRVLVLSTTARVAFQFERKGYLDAKVEIAGHKDPAAHTIGYTYTVEPGPQYRFKSVATPGFTPQQQQEFDKNWRLQSGAIYDGDYVLAFFEKNRMSSFKDYVIRPNIQPDRTDHTVKVTYTSTKRSS